MPELTLIQKQRAILRRLRQATTQRALAENEAAARREVERKAADAALNQARQTAAARLAEARKASRVQAVLAWASLKHLLEQTSPSPPAPTPSADPAQELARCVETATNALGTIRENVAELQWWREAKARRHRRLAIAAAVAVIILMVIYAIYV